MGKLPDAATIYKNGKDALEGYTSQKNEQRLPNECGSASASKTGETIDSHAAHGENNLLNLEKAAPSIIEFITLTQLVNNTTNGSLRKKGLKDGLSLTNFLTTARAIEGAEQQALEIGGGDAIYQLTTTDYRSSEQVRHKGREDKGSKYSLYVRINVPINQNGTKTREDMFSMWAEIPTSRTMCTCKQNLL